MGKLDIPYAKIPVIKHNNEFWHQWCCDCELRHTYHFRIIRGKIPEDDKIEISVDRDDWATIAAKVITKQKKQIAKLRVSEAGK